jgi:hypothetical protein
MLGVKMLGVSRRQFKTRRNQTPPQGLPKTVFATADREPFRPTIFPRRKLASGRPWSPLAWPKSTS